MGTLQSLLHDIEKRFDAVDRRFEEILEEVKQQLQSRDKQIEQLESRQTETEACLRKAEACLRNEALCKVTMAVAEIFAWSLCSEYRGKANESPRNIRRRMNDSGVSEKDKATNDVVAWMSGVSTPEDMATVFDRAYGDRNGDCMIYQMSTAQAAGSLKAMIKTALAYEVYLRPEDLLEERRILHSHFLLDMQHGFLRS